MVLEQNKTISGTTFFFTPKTAILRSADELLPGVDDGLQGVDDGFPGVNDGLRGADDPFPGVRD